MRNDEPRRVRVGRRPTFATNCDKSPKLPHPNYMSTNPALSTL
jgi:hypothetical protein